MEWDDHDKRIFSLNIRVMHILQRALSDDIYVKASKSSNAKDILNTFDSLYLSYKCCEHVNENLQVKNLLNHQPIEEKGSSHASSEESSNMCFMVNKEEKVTSTFTLIIDIENDHDS